MLARDEHAAMRAPAEWQPGTPRRVFWALLTCALLVSLALPLVTLWRASAPGLAARACVWPAEPRAGALAQALIVVPASVALASAQGEAPAVQMVVTMPGMAMPTERMSVAGPSR